MKCPLLVSGWWSKEPGFKTSKTDCLKQECAWWNVGLECCHIREIAVSLEVLSDSLDEISAKMPSGQSFVK